MNERDGWDMDEALETYTAGEAGKKAKKKTEDGEESEIEYADR